MTKTYSLELDELDIGQLLDGIENRAESWERTAEYFRTGEMPEGEMFIVEDCSDMDEATAIATHFRSIISAIRRQLHEQRSLP